MFGKFVDSFALGFINNHSQIVIMMKIWMILNLMRTMQSTIMLQPSLDMVYLLITLKTHAMKDMESDKLGYGSFFSFILKLRGEVFSRGFSSHCSSQCFTNSKESTSVDLESNLQHE